MQMGGEATQAPEGQAPMQAGPPVEGRRTQLKRVRENIESLSRDVGRFRKSHESSTKRLEKQVASLRKDLASLRSQTAKDAARSSAKLDAKLSRIMAKVSAKPKASKPVKRSKKR